MSQVVTSAERKYRDTALRRIGRAVEHVETEPNRPIVHVEVKFYGPSERWVWDGEKFVRGLREVRP